MHTLSKAIICAAVFFTNAAAGAGAETDSIPAPQQSSSQGLIRTCTYKGAFYAAAASARDAGQSPQETYSYIKSLRQRVGVDISDQYIKTAINQVFFDTGFIQAGGPPLQYQVMQACAAKKPLGYEPLK